MQEGEPMTEHPIIFSTDMVKAILDGRKTMTRWVIKNKWGLCAECFGNGVPHNIVESVFVDAENRPVIYLKLPYCEHNDTGGGRIWCPYGQVGDRLWVRETWAYQEWEMGSYSDWGVIYKADNPNEMDRENWKPSIHLSREDSRITLKITELRVERLQEITIADIKAEGVTPHYDCDEITYQALFQQVWDSLNAKRGYGWDTNCWVWVISFKRLVTDG